MDAEARAAGRVRVRDLLLERLAHAGMVRAKGVTLDAHSDMLKRLAERLAYMAPQNLITLSELVIEAAQGGAKNVWPAEATVIGMANDLERSPVVEHRIVYSWLASVEGPAAVAAGIEVELFRFLAQHRRPPSGGVDNRRIREQSEQNHHQIELIRGRIERGTANANDREWLSWYLRERQKVRRIIEAGKAKRAAA